MPRLSKTTISDLTVRSAKPKAARFEIRDAELRGFILRVNPSGTKSWYVQIDRNRKRKIGDAAVLTASVARYRARDLLLRGDHLRQGRSGTLGGFLEGPYAEWMDRNSRYGVRDTQRLVRALRGLADQPMDQIGTSHIERWRLQRTGQVRPATVLRELGALQAALGKAQAWQLISENPARRVRYRPGPRTNGTRKLGDAERERLMDRLARRRDALAVLTVTALNTGLSRGELFRLAWRDIQFGIRPAIELRSGRGQRLRSRRVPLNTAAADALSNWSRIRPQRGALVFPGPRGGPMKNISAAWSGLMREARIRNFRLSDCRHDFAARLAAAGVPLSAIQSLLGLSSLNLVERYAAFSTLPIDAAVEKLT